MTLFDLKKILSEIDTIEFQLPSGEIVPKHFHLTEIGKLQKTFIDCGGVLRKETFINMQLWAYEDKDHRLSPTKLTAIIDTAIEKLDIDNDEIEVEYQGKTIEKYALDFSNEKFQLIAKETNCLAKEACIIPEFTLTTTTNKCDASSGCC